MEYEQLRASDTNLVLTTDELIKHILVNRELQFAMQRDPDAIRRVGL